MSVRSCGRPRPQGPDTRGRPRVGEGGQGRPERYPGGDRISPTIDNWFLG